MSKILIVFFILCQFSCVVDREQERAKNGYASLLKDFLLRKSHLEGPEGTLCFADKCLSKLADTTTATTPFLADYNTAPIASVPLLMACFPYEMTARIPSIILEAIKEYRVEKEFITFCLNVQANGSLLEKDARTGEKFTRLKAHGWLSPDAPKDEELRGDLANRNLLFGIYDAPSTLKAIPGGLVEHQLVPFPVHTHQVPAGRLPLSPLNMAKIAIHEDSPSLSFFSLVIDAWPPAGLKRRAGITLHLILDSNDADSGQSLEKLFEMLNESDKKISFGDFIHQLRNLEKDTQKEYLQPIKAIFRESW
ncbi:MAG: hypothetical protein H6731_00400 [Myxococcales bacterium]|nr:MAG: hypothetical protein H6731_00400 [Myxococcales bacterium]